MISSVPTFSPHHLTLTSTPGDIQCADFLCSSTYLDCDSWQYPVCRLRLLFTLPRLWLLLISSVRSFSFLRLARTTITLCSKASTVHVPNSIEKFLPLFVLTRTRLFYGWTKISCKIGFLHILRFQRKYYWAFIFHVFMLKWAVYE